MNNLSAWRVEWIRLARTHRLVVLAGIFVLFGLTEPLAARYLPTLLKASSGARLKISAAPPVPADGIGAYARNALQVGLIVVVIVAAFTFAIEARPAMSVFYRTRARTFGDLLVPRAVVTACAAVGAYLLGLGAAWYETSVLIAAPGPVAIAESAVLGSLYLVFAVAVTAAAGTVARGTLGTAGIALVVLLLVPIAGTVPQVTSWLPSTLAGAPSDLLRDTAVGEYRDAAIVAGVAAVVLVAGACWLGSRREVR